MKTIFPQTEAYEKIIGIQKYENDIQYRRFQFVAELCYNSKVLWLNTLSHQMIEIDKEEYNVLCHNNNSPLTERLVNAYFLVPYEHNDFELKNQYFSLLPLFVNKKGLTSFVIMPTMDCNARCFYCFEHGMRRYPMTDKTAQDVADFIIKKSLSQKIKILWFGGEPLYNQSAIDIITNKLISENREFKSTMITNGYLFDMEIVERAKNNWNLKNVQITLDGTEEVYNRCKNYIYKN